jgi:hypothetical protein
MVLNIDAPELELLSSPGLRLVDRDGLPLA